AATCVISVDGESGVGKSSLLGQFCEQLERDGALVLRGRCHPNESIPYNAFDALVDSLSRHLEHQDPARVRALRPRRVRALLQLFPVLRNVESLRDEGQAGPTPEPRELRRQGFAALSELFGRLCLNQRVVLWLDDAQWGDRDSAALLREVVLAEDAPECLFVVSYRGRVGEHFRFLESLEEVVSALPNGRHLHLPVEPLDPDAARLLARRLLGAKAPEERIE